MHSWLIKRINRIQRGFTLVELLIVISILSVLAVIAVPALFSLIGSGEEEAFATDKDLLQKIVYVYYVAEDGVYPTFSGGAGVIDFDKLIAGGYLAERPASAAELGSVKAAAIDGVRKYVWAIDAQGIITTTYNDTASAYLVMNLTFNEGSGDMAYDSSADATHQNDGTLINGPMWTVGNDGSGLQFDGSDDYVSVTDDDSLDITEMMTIEAWVKINNFTDDGYLLAKNMSTDQEVTYAVYIDSGERLHVVLDNTDLDTGYVVSKGLWKHLVVTWNGTTVRLYVDGSERWSEDKSGPLTPNSRRLVVGARNDDGGPGTLDHFDGLIDEFRIYNRSLSSGTIQTRYDETNNGVTGDTMALNLAFNEAEGSVAYDSSTYGNDGTLANTPTWATGKVGSGLQFDGSDDYVSVPDDNSLDITDEITIEAWVRINDFSSKGYMLAKNFGDFGDGGEMAYAVYIHQNESLMVVLDDVEENTQYTVPTGQWKHLVLTWDGSIITLFVDGSETWSTSKSGSLSTNDQRLVIGARNDSGGPDTVNHFNGIIDELRIHSIALSAAEVQVRYDDTKGDPGGEDPPPESSLVMDIQFDEGSGNTAYDSTSFQNDGMLTNGPTWTTGQVGNALQFDGDDDYVAVADSDSLDITDAITIEAWVNTNDLAAAGYIVSKNSKLNSMPYAVYIQSTENVYVVFDETDWNTGYVMPIGQWKHIAVTWDGATVRLYVDGSETWSTSESGPLGTNNKRLVIGARNDTGQNTIFEFDGVIDELRIHNTALSADDVQTRYDETK